MERRPGLNYLDPYANKRKPVGEPQGPVRFPEITNSEDEEALYDWPEGRK